MLRSLVRVLTKNIKGENIYEKVWGFDSEAESNNLEAYISFVVNQNYPISKTFDNVEYGGDFTGNTNFSEIYFETNAAQ